MKRTLALAIALVSALVLATPDHADARRIGGGRSFGAQRSITPAPSLTAPSSGIASNPVMPSAASAAAARGIAPAAATAGASRWLGPIAGIAAGLGLAALFSHFGMSEGFGSILLILVVAGAGLFLVRMLLARRSGATPAPLRYSASGAAGAPLSSAPARFEPVAPRVEPAAAGFEPAWGAGASPAAATPPARRFPPGFEPAPFLAEAKRQFTALQQAYDRGDVGALSDVLTPEMHAQIGRELAERGTHVPTEVVSLNGDVLEVATEGDQHWASVRFTGLTREDGKAQPEPFDEVWNLVKPVKGSFGWRLAGIQQYA